MVERDLQVHPGPWGRERGRHAGDTDVALQDKAMQVCPVGVMLRKDKGFSVPIGRRVFDLKPISAYVDASDAIAKE